MVKLLKNLGLMEIMLRAKSINRTYDKNIIALALNLDDFLGYHNVPRQRRCGIS